ncbi:MAG: hypothetical protein VX733_00585, partial [Candidatus Latescibacterota bacterium]|nr:hypothetical protein [Candidatus Latescibacterota bacterium]
QVKRGMILHQVPYHEDKTTGLGELGQMCGVVVPKCNRLFDEYVLPRLKRLEGGLVVVRNGYGQDHCFDVAG